MSQIQNRKPAKSAKQDLTDLEKASKENSKGNDPRQGPNPKEGSGAQPKK